MKCSQRCSGSFARAQRKTLPNDCLTGSERGLKLLGFTLRGGRGGKPPPACPSPTPVACRGGWLAFRSLPHSVVERDEEHEKPSCRHDDGQVDQKNRVSLAHIGMPDRARSECCHVGTTGTMHSKEKRFAPCAVFEFSTAAGYALANKSEGCGCDHRFTNTNSPEPAGLGSEASRSRLQASC